MQADYSKAALMRFFRVAADQGLLNANTAAGWSSACARILEDVTDSDDVRTVDPKTAIKRYHNKHPGALKGTVLKEYERRLTYALGDFVQYVENPTEYTGRGRGPTTDSGSRPSRASANTQKSKKNAAVPTPAAPAPAAPTAAQWGALAGRPGAIAGLSLEFPIRPDFLAQIVVPRDMKADEARRLSRFIMALAHDYEPKVGEL